MDACVHAIYRTKVLRSNPQAALTSAITQAAASRAAFMIVMRHVGGVPLAISGSSVRFRGHAAHPAVVLRTAIRAVAACIMSNSFLEHPILTSLPGRNGVGGRDLNHTPDNVWRRRVKAWWKSGAGRWI
jgi:hypothetical protein